MIFPHIHYVYLQHQMKVLQWHKWITKLFLRNPLHSIQAMIYTKLPLWFKIG